MFGLLRVMLALMVALSHANVSLSGYHLGVPAVVVFFMLSGYVVDALAGPGGPMFRRPWRFYGERAARLLPLYYAAAALGACAVLLHVHSPFLQGAQRGVLWFNSALILPLTYATLWPVIDTLTLVPPAWSLGLELHYYLLAPWILPHRRTMAALGAASIVIGGAAHLGLLPSDAWGYRLLPGTLWLFLAGAWLHRVAAHGARAGPLIIAWLIALALLVMTALQGRWGQPFVTEVLGGFLLGLPLLSMLATLPRRRWDDEIAQLAYGIFLMHFAVQWLAPVAGWLDGAARPLLLYIVLTVVLAAAAHLLVERPLLRWRRRLRTDRIP